MKKTWDFERFTQVKEFSKLSEIFKKWFYSFNIFCDRADFKECFKIDEFYFSGLGKKPISVGYYGIDGYFGIDG